VNETKEIETTEIKFLRNLVSDTLKDPIRNIVSLSLWLRSHLDLGCFLSFSVAYIVGRTP
jgi:hypothetical protein